MEIETIIKIELLLALLALFFLIGLVIGATFSGNCMIITHVKVPPTYLKPIMIP